MSHLYFYFGYFAVFLGFFFLVECVTLRIHLVFTALTRISSVMCCVFCPRSLPLSLFTLLFFHVIRRRFQHVGLTLELGVTWMARLLLTSASFGPSPGCVWNTNCSHQLPPDIF